jgi:hypothetical protein
MKCARANRIKPERCKVSAQANKKPELPLGYDVRDTLRDADTIRTAELIEARLPKERRTLFRKLWIAYEKQQSRENFLQLTSEFPEVEIGVPPLFSNPLFLRPEMVKYGVNPDFIATFGDDIVVSIDKLSMRLIELLVDRAKLPKRRDQITDTLVNSLIIVML